MNKYNFTDYFDLLKSTINKLDINLLEKLTDTLLECRDIEKTIYIFGNGGSGATASHVAGDFLKGISYLLEKRFRIMSLNDNQAGITAISNDLSYNEIFIEQLKTFLTKDDVVIGISGSGNSENVVKALEYAKNNNATTVAICGFKGGKIKEIADIVIHAPVNDMEITEDIHLMIFHAVKQQIISKIKGNDFSMGEIYDKRVL